VPLLPGPLVMGLVLMVDPWAKHVDWSGGAAFELRGGVAPPQPSVAPVPTLRLTVSPQGTMIYQDRVRGREVSLDYAPQFVLSVFEGKRELSAVPYRPIQFHRATLRYAGDLSRRWSWSGSAGGSIGEQDYSLQSGGLVQGDGTIDSTAPAQATLIDQPIITTGGFSAAVGLTARVTPLHSVSLRPSVTVQRLLSEPPSTGGSVVSFDQTSGALDLSHAWFASRVDTIGTRISGGYADFGPVNGSQAFGSGDVVWSRRLRPRLDGQLLGGVFVTQQVRVRDMQSAVSPSRARSLPILPIANVGLSGRLLERSRLRITTNINAGSQAYFDPVQGSVLPLAGGGASFDVYLPPDLSVGIATTFYTPPTRPTDFEYRNADDPATARTALTVRTPVIYTIDRNLAIEVGTIVNARGPNVRTGIPRQPSPPATIDDVDLDDIVFDPWRFTQTEFWLYVSFNMRYGTARGT
jgi:hypothetical protein